MKTSTAEKQSETKKRTAVKIRASVKKKSSARKQDIAPHPETIETVEAVNSVETVNVVEPETTQHKESVLDLVSMLVHDLESPLASMNYTLELMESGRFDDSNALHKRMLEGAQVALKRAETIVADMLTAAKSENTDITVNWQDVNLFEIAENAVQMGSPAAAQNGVKVVLDPASENCDNSVLKADPNLVSRIIDNLIFNAVRHTPSKGIVRVSVTCEENEVSMIVTDTGEGIQGIDPEKLFEKFGQVEYRKQKKHRGVGLGLFFCRIASEAMKAKLFARNAPSGGAQFGITFPITNSTD